MNTDFFGERGQAIGYVAREYEQLLGRTVSRSAIEDIGFFIDCGIEDKLMVKAIEITGGKNADWRYTKAILKRCQEEGILTLEAYNYRLIYKKVMLEFKSKYPNCDENTLFPFVVIEAGRRAGYLEKIQKELATLI